MTSFFNVANPLAGNPFSTAVGQRIEQATDASLASENWALNMEICDLINESSDVARDAMKAIRKRLTQNAGKNNTVIMYTLTVLETCVKNCGKAFHVLVANKEFVQELVKLIGPKNDPPAVVQEKVLSLIQIWADAFRSQPDLNGVVQVYNELKGKGIEFPAADLDALAPIYTPQRSVPDAVNIDGPTNINSPMHANQQVTPAAVNVPPAGLTPEQIAKLQSELDIVSLNMQIFGEMLTELKPGQEDPADHQLLIDLSNTCKDMQGRVVELIGKVNLDEFTAELLRINDELNNLFLRYARYEKNRDPKAASTPLAILGQALGQPDMSKDSLIDLGGGEEAAVGGVSSQFAGLGIGTATSQLSQINSVSAQSGASHKSVDEFDMLAQSRNTTVDAKGNIKEAIPNKPSGGATGRETTEFDEMAEWLGKSGPPNDEEGPEESLTSKEFDKFLAERALAADNLPSINSQTGSTNNASDTPRHKKKEDETGLLAL